MNQELPFTGFHEHILAPLSTDLRSLAQVKRLFIEQKAPSSQPFALLVHLLTGREYQNDEALLCWQQLLKHKHHLQQKLGRAVGIQTAAVDYFEYLAPGELKLSFPNALSDSKARGEAAYGEAIIPEYRLEKLKEEMLRAKRYKHALSVVMIDLDNFHQFQVTNARTDTTHPPGTYVRQPPSPAPVHHASADSDEILTLIVQIISKTTRNVDFLSRLTGDRFLLVLPNTNLREAKELAERIRVQILERTKRYKKLAAGITATLSVCQSTLTDTSIEFIRKLERLLDDGKKKGRNTVYTAP